MTETKAQNKWRLKNKNTESYKIKNSLYMREYRKNNREQFLKLSRESYHRHAPQYRDARRQLYLDQPWLMLSRLSKARSKKKELLFDLTPEYIKSIWPENNKCPILNEELLSCSRQEKGRNYSPSLDRIIPDKGYVIGNVVVVSTKANRIKNNATMEEIKAVFEYYNKILNI